MSFAERLRALRAERHLSQADVAAAIGISWRNYQKLEVQTSLPNYHNLLALADFFQVPEASPRGRTENRATNRKTGKRPRGPHGCRGSFCTLISRAGSGWRGC